jgi:ATP phosphoribosyltransferase
MNGKLLLAVPSKGRLQDNADTFFRRSGLVFKRARGVRDYRGAIAGVPDAEVLFLSASEIAGELARGAVHLGVTGEDLIRERIADADEKTTFVTPLGFGHARVVVAVPQFWLDVESMADLADVARGFRARHGRRLRVATKYVTLARGFFARHGMADYRIVESLGATEGAPASGAADLIVDITSSGATLAANALKILPDGVILESEANLVASLTAEWPETTRATLRTLLDRIAAEALGRTTMEIRARFSEAGKAEQLDGVHKAILLGSWGDTARFRCPQATLYECVEALRAAGASDVAVSRMDYVFAAANPMLDAVIKRLG